MMHGIPGPLVDDTPTYEFLIVSDDSLLGHCGGFPADPDNPGHARVPFHQAEHLLACVAIASPELAASTTLPFASSLLSPTLLVGLADVIAETPSFDDEPCGLDELGSRIAAAAASLGADPRRLAGPDSFVSLDTTGEVVSAADAFALGPAAKAFCIGPLVVAGEDLSDYGILAGLAGARHTAATRKARLLPLAKSLVAASFDLSFSPASADKTDAIYALGDALGLPPRLESIASTSSGWRRDLADRCDFISTETTRVARAFARRLPMLLAKRDATPHLRRILAGAASSELLPLVRALSTGIGIIAPVDSTVTIDSVEARLADGPSQYAWAVPLSSASARVSAIVAGVAASAARLAAAPTALPAADGHSGRSSSSTGVAALVRMNQPALNRVMLSAAGLALVAQVHAASTHLEVLAAVFNNPSVSFFQIVLSSGPIAIDDAALQRVAAARGSLSRYLSLQLFTQDDGVVEPGAAACNLPDALTSALRRGKLTDVAWHDTVVHPHAAALFGQDDQRFPRDSQAIQDPRALGRIIVLLGRLSAALGFTAASGALSAPFDHARWILENHPPGVQYAAQQDRILTQAMIDMSATFAEVLRAPPDALFPTYLWDPDAQSRALFTEFSEAYAAVNQTRRSGAAKLLGTAAAGLGAQAPPAGAPHVWSPTAAPPGRAPASPGKTGSGAQARGLGGIGATPAVLNGDRLSYYTRGNQEFTYDLTNVARAYPDIVGMCPGVVLSFNPDPYRRLRFCLCPSDRAHQVLDTGPHAPVAGRCASHSSIWF